MRKIIGRPLAILTAAGIGVAALLAAGAGVSTAAPAPAAAPAVHAMAAPVAKPKTVQPANLLADHVTQNGVNMRECASTSCAVVGTANASDNLHSWCFVSGQEIIANGRDTVFWDIVYNVSSGHAGFITEAYLTNTSQSSAC